MVLASALGVALWIALARSWNSYIYGGGWLVWCVWFSATVYAVRRSRGSGVRLQIVATGKGLRAPTWEVDWDRVDRMKVGYISGGRVKALVIAPMRSEDIRRPKSAVLRLNSLASKVTGEPEVRILQANVDTPLEDIAVEFERLAERSLLV
jgi:hypothetical protein